ncbi:DUF3991 domain-containing protein [[Clostridium] innocuum]|nr:DUF3991 domain-containing protein [[Clostridium] innocuum]
MTKYIPFSKEQIQRANNIDLSDFLKRQGEILEKSGKEMRWMQNSSVTLKGNRWYQHKYQEGGYPISFLQKFYHYSFPEAVQLLLNESGIPYEQAHHEEQEVKEFHAPIKNPTLKRVYGYLLKQRYIDRNVLNTFTEQGLIYESEKYHNVVFAGFDEEGTMRHAHKRATFGNYRGNETGSDPRFSFHWNGTSNKIYVFEAPIDLLSYISLHSENWQEHHYVALNGVSIQPLLHQLEVHNEIAKVNLCLDHDIAGSEAMSRIQEELEENGYSVVIEKKFAILKDWNEELKQVNGVQELQEGIDNLKPVLFQQFLKKYTKQFHPFKEELEIKHIMDQYLSIFPILNQKGKLDVGKIRNCLCELSSRAFQYHQQISKCPIEIEDALIKQYRPHKDRGDQKKRLELLKESIHKLKDCYINKEVPQRQERLQKLLLDVADDSMMLIAYFDMQEDLKQYIQEEYNMDQNRKPKCPLIGTDGNVFALIGMTQKSLRAIGEDELAKEVFQRVTSSGSYEEALGIMQEYVDVTSVDEFNEQVFMELDQFKMDARNIENIDIKEICLDVMTSVDTDDALNKIQDYRKEYLPSMEMNLS